MGTGVAHGAGLEALDAQDRADLEDGRLAALRARYTQRSFADLADAQLRVLCDVHAKFNDLSRALECLDALERRLARGGTMDRTDRYAIGGKRAYLMLLAGQYEEAARLAATLDGDAARYVEALARARLGATQEAEAIARRFGAYADPRRVFFAASLYVACGRYAQARDLLLSPAKRLSLDYDLKSHKDIFDRDIGPADFRLDLFDEFRFGLFGGFSYAPRANVYVEFLIARSELGTDRRDRARQSLDAIVGYRNIASFRDVHWMALFERGHLSELEGRPEQAIGDYRRAIDVLEAIRSSLATDVARIGFVRDKQEVYQRLIALLIARGDFELAMTYMERSRSRVLVDLMSAKERFVVASPVLQKSLATLADVDAELRSGLLVDRGVPFATRQVTREQTGEALARAAPMLALGVAPPAVEFSDMERGIAADEAVVYFYFIGDDLVVAVAEKGRPLFMRTLDRRNVRNAVREFRSDLANPVSVAYLDSAQRLYDWLLKPVEDRLARHRRLTIVPAGLLIYVPFAALHTGSEFVVQKYTLRVLPSFRISLLIPPSLPGAASTLVLGNPARPGEAPLRGAQREAESIRRRAPQALVLMGPDATEAAFRDFSGTSAYVHIASHATFDAGNPLASRLLLAPRPPDDGAVTVSSLLERPGRLTANLVVLSACNTAVNAETAGSELLGLTYAFLVAGSRGVVGTLWQIDDDNATPMLMDELYRRLLVDRHPPAQALQEAQIATMRRFAHPYFWAPFQFTGRLDP